MTLLGGAMLVAGKDLLVELRSRRGLVAAAPFVVTVLLSLGLALGPGQTLLREVAPGVLWVTVLFAAILVVRQGWAAEAEDDAVESLLLGDVDGGAVFLGKTGALSLELLVVEAVAAGLASLLFDRSFVEHPVGLLGALLLATVGLAAIGTLFGVTSAAPGSGEGLPLLVLPLATPILLAGVQATGAAVNGAPASVEAWLGLLAAFDLVILSLGVLAFDQLLEER